MKLSELVEEIEKAKGKPSVYIIAALIIVISGAVGFIGYKCLNGECSGECQSPVYKMSRGAACGVELYVSKESEACGVAEYKSGTAAQCGVELYKECETSGCGWMKLGGVFDIGKTKANTCRHSNCGVETYKTCKHPDFGVASYKVCRHESNGIELFKLCRKEEFGLEKCNDAPFWQFWKWG